MLANDKSFKIAKRTINLTLYAKKFQPYTSEFIILSMPEGQDMLCNRVYYYTINYNSCLIHINNNTICNKLFETLVYILRLALKIFVLKR